MDKQERERREIERAFATDESASLRTGDFMRIGDIGGFRKALEVCDRMMQTAPTSAELYGRKVQEAQKLGKKPPCRLCDDIGYTLTENVARICECRIAAMRAAQRRQQEQVRPERDLVSALFGDDPA